jgi:hypothetical protein
MKQIMKQTKGWFKHIVFLIVTLTLAVGFGLFLMPKLVKAQNTPVSQTIEVSPPQQDLTADPGSVVSFKVKVRNAGPRDMSLKATVEDFTAKGDEGQVTLGPSNQYSVVSWVSVEPAQFTVKSGEIQEVNATVSIPGNAAGGRYGSVIFSTDPTITPQNGEVAALSQQVAALFLLNINGPKTEKLNIESFSAPKFLEFGPVPFSLVYSNTGNIHLKPQGLINVSDMFGHKATDVTVTGYNVYPGAKRQVNVKWDKRMIIGKYTANAIVYTGGTNNDTMTATVTFIVFPVRIVAIALLAIVILFLMRKRLSKAFKVIVSGK